MRLQHDQITASNYLMQKLQTIIDDAFVHCAHLSPQTVSKTVKDAVITAIELLDSGQARVAEKIAGQWQVHEWLKKAVLLYFRIHDSQLMCHGYMKHFDKIPPKYQQYAQDEFVTSGVRIAPPAVARKGAYIAPNTILMPSYVNIGAYIDTGTMIDTWATVGSCAQIGKNVHLSGGVGIGGVLEPLQAYPTIIEDYCFIGARSEIVEGVIVEEGAVISMGVFIGQSTRIYHRETNTTLYGRVPAGSVVVPGNLPSKDGKYSLYCAVIVKQVDAQTRCKTNLNELLRELE
jgi:2,3,4,5-tetrahydropyridine-2,6-dicarboxylate N-succinyltransferase